MAWEVSSFTGLAHLTSAQGASRQGEKTVDEPVEFAELDPELDPVAARRRPFWFNHGCRWIPRISPARDHGGPSLPEVHSFVRSAVDRSSVRPPLSVGEAGPFGQALLRWLSVCLPSIALRYCSGSVSELLS